MRYDFLILAGMTLLAGCSFDVPDFLGREGNGAQSNAFSVGGDAPVVPPPVTLPLRSAEAEAALHGVILRAEGISPTQGYYAALLTPLNGGAPDAAGIVTFDLTAIPPTGVEAVGPEGTRTLRAAFFFPNSTLRDIRAMRIKGGANVLTVTAPRPPVAPPILSEEVPRL